MSNLNRILETALRVFNERGSHAVTTNALADEVGISVGNLYYHFRNKEEIIRRLFEGLNDAWRTRLVVDTPGRLSWTELEVLVARHFEVLWEYRFFYREQTSLRQRDPVLARTWTIAHQRGRADMAALLHALTSQAGGKVSGEAIDQVTDACWILADYWLPFMESRGRSLRKSDLASGVCLFASTIRPLLDSLSPARVK